MSMSPKNTGSTPTTMRKMNAIAMCLGVAEIELRSINHSLIKRFGFNACGFASELFLGVFSDPVFEGLARGGVLAGELQADDVGKRHRDSFIGSLGDHPHAQLVGCAVWLAV